jgi:hypothetical protein
MYSDPAFTIALTLNHAIQIRPSDARKRAKYPCLVCKEHPTSFFSTYPQLFRELIVQQTDYHGIPSPRFVPLRLPRT